MCISKLRWVRFAVVLKCIGLFVLTSAPDIGSIAVAAESSPAFHSAPPQFGKVLDKEQQSSLYKHVFSDGRGLPEGSGTAETGQPLYAEHCAGCHGTQGQGGRALELVGDRSLLNTEYPDRGIAVYWPYAPTLFEYIYRAMPPDKPASLEANELYAIIAHLLVLNGLIDPDVTVNAEVLSSIEMPNVNGFKTIGR